MNAFKHFFLILLISSVANASLDSTCFDEKTYCSAQTAVDDCDDQDSREVTEQDHCVNNCIQSYTLPTFNVSLAVRNLNETLLTSYRFFYESHRLDAPFQPPKVQSSVF